MKFKTMLILVWCCTLHSVWAQTDTAEDTAASPISIESFFGSKGALVEMTFSKSFTPSSPFGILSISEYYGTYKADKQATDNQYMAQTYLTYRLHSNILLAAGAMMNNVDGLRPSVGVEYSLPGKDFFFLIMPRIDLTQTHNAEALSLIEYTPALKNQWSLYSRIEGLYNRDLQNKAHGISYLRLRLGLSYKIYRFGLGTNFAWYGPEKFNDNQVGIFAGILL